MPKKLILIVIDGLTPDVFEGAVDTGAAPTRSLSRATTPATDGPVSTSAVKPAAARWPSRAPGTVAGPWPGLP